jgi:uncharacterized protein YbbK (DUF523 family)
MKPRVGISRCLLGDLVRYDGRHKRDDIVLTALRDVVEWVPVCPEVEVGMGTPREPIQLVAVDGGVRLVGVTTGRDWTARMEEWAAERVRELGSAGISGFVLKSGSPSCGLADVPVMGSLAASGDQGVFAAVLCASLPDLPVQDEAHLQDPETRASFLARVRAYAARQRVEGSAAR